MIYEWSIFRIFQSLALNFLYAPAIKMVHDSAPDPAEVDQAATVAVHRHVSGMVYWPHRSYAALTSGTACPFLHPARPLAMQQDNLIDGCQFYINIIQSNILADLLFSF